MRAVIFDMDGVLSDTQKLHAKVESELLAARGVVLSPAEVTDRYAGVETKTFFKELLHLPEDTIDAIIGRKWHRMSQEAPNAQPIEGSPELVRYLHRNGYALGVASASKLVYVRSVIETLELDRYFRAITSAEQVHRGKPFPDLFLYCARKLKVSPLDCVVIEDGRSGMIAAQRAGMRCIGLVTPGTESTYPADVHVHTLSEIKNDLLDSLYRK